MYPPELQPEYASRGVTTMDLTAWAVVAALVSSTAVQGAAYHRESVILHQMTVEAQRGAVLMQADLSGALDLGVDNNGGEGNLFVGESANDIRYVLELDGSFRVTVTSSQVEQWRVVYASEPDPDSGLRYGINKVPAGQ